jgi:hypothetical protein
MRIAGSAVGLALMLSLTSGAVAQDVGVPACDEFLNKYNTCIGSKVPAEQRATMTNAMSQVRTNWINVAKTAEGKAQLATVCKQTADQLKQQVAALNCAW